VQARRWTPTVATQALQQVAHRRVIQPVLDAPGGEHAGPPRTPRPVRLLHRFPQLQAVPAYAVAIGLLPEHAPAFARRPPVA
jgi:hypothetical protein